MKLLYLRICRGKGTKRSLAMREKDADWCNMTCFCFFWPWCLLRRESKISKRTREEAGLNIKACFGGGGKQEGNLDWLSLSSTPEEKFYKQSCCLRFLLCFPCQGLLLLETNSDVKQSSLKCFHWKICVELKWSSSAAITTPFVQFCDEINRVFLLLFFHLVFMAFVQIMLQGHGLFK